jgi:hypothetical protein
MQTVRSLRRAFGALSVLLLAVSGPLLATAQSASAAVGQSVQSSSPTADGSAEPLIISITRMTPSTAEPNKTVTISGTLTNHSGAAQSISVQAWSSGGTSIEDSAQIQEFSSGNDDSAFIHGQIGPPDTLPDSVANGATVPWSVSFPASDLGADALGVFPIAVQATYGNTFGPVARTFLPYWPGNSSGVKPLQVSWIWPLIDTPQQGACMDTLATPELADSVKPGGRLNTLLSVGAANAQSHDLTWAIDPALLSDVHTMTSKYDTNGNGDCSGRLPAAADPAATSWLNSLKTATSDSESFLTPYANVDAAALAHADANLDGTILKPAYQLGKTVASEILPDTFGKNDSVADGGNVLNAAMPAGGQADSETVGDLAIDGGVNTVILSNTLPSAPQGTAIAKTISTTGTGTISLLYADSGITATLGSASPTASESSQFSLTQTFLAETALIAAEAPATARSLVIEPPTGWDPSAQEATTLLQDSTEPWLQPTKLSALSAEAAALPATSITQLQPQKIYPGELDDNFMDRVEDVATQVAEFKELLYKPSTRQLNQLTAALAVTASSAWRGSNSSGGYLAYAQLRTYLRDAEDDVLLISSPKILLTGQSGVTSVSVQNELSEPIEVQVTGTPPAKSGLTLNPSSVTLIVLPEQSRTTHVTMSVSSGTLGTTIVPLQLRTMEGTALSGSHTSQKLSVEATPFGHYLLIIIGAALGILVLTSVYRVRRKRAADAVRASAPDETAKAGGTG